MILMSLHYLVQLLSNKTTVFSAIESWGLGQNVTLHILVFPVSINAYKIMAVIAETFEPH